MIKKKVTKNVVLSAAELEYLSNALKEEIMNLRGQLVKAGMTYGLVSNKKILSFIKNEEYTIDGKDMETGAQSNMLEKAESSKTTEASDSQSEGEKNIGLISAGPSTRGNINLRKRNSILHLDEEGLILKYCELRAKFENLEQASRNKLIYEHSKESQAEELIDDVKNEASKKINEIDEKRMEELNEIKIKLEKEKEEYQKSQIELEKKLAILENEKFKLEEDIISAKKETEGVQEFANLLENDNNTTQEKLEKKSI